MQTQPWTGWTEKFLTVVKFVLRWQNTDDRPISITIHDVEVAVIVIMIGVDEMIVIAIAGGLHLVDVVAGPVLDHPNNVDEVILDHRHDFINGLHQNLQKDVHIHHRGVGLVHGR